MSAQEALRITVGNEADVVGVGLVGHTQAEAFSLGAYPRLVGSVPQRQDDAVKLLGPHDGQHVGLVLEVVGTAVQLGSGLAINDGRVVAGAHRIEAELAGAGGQLAELHELIAAHAGVGGAPGLVLGDEVGDDSLLKFLSKIPHVERDADNFGGARRVAGVLDRAAAARADAALLGLGGQGHVDADDVVPGLHGLSGGDGGIHAAGQCCQNSHLAVLVSFVAHVGDSVQGGPRADGHGQGGQEGVDVVARRLMAERDAQDAERLLLATSHRHDDLGGARDPRVTGGPGGHRNPGHVEGHEDGLGAGGGQGQVDDRARRGRLPHRRIRAFGQVGQQMRA